MAKRCLSRAATLGMVFLLAACGPDRPALDAAVSTASVSPRAARGAEIPFIVDAQRILVEVVFFRPDGTQREVLAWFNMGMAEAVLSDALFHDLKIGANGGGPVTLRIGTVDLAVAPEAFVDGDGKIGGDREFEHYFGPYPVEAVLPAGLLQKFLVTIDYDRRVLALAPPGTVRPEGVGVPFRLNPATGFAVIDATVAGKAQSFVIDAGSGYTWIRGSTMAQWLASDPEWRRANGAVGEANNAMVDYDFEKAGTVARVPEMSIGAVALEDVGVFGTGPLLGRWGDALFGELFWDHWQKSAPEPIVGWLGGNVLEQFKLTIDYPGRMIYWQRRRPPDPHDLDGVGITLVRRSGRYFVGGIVRKSRPGAGEVATVAGVDVGDELMAVGDLAVPNATKEAVLSALHGAPGESRKLVLDRKGRRIEIAADVTAFD